MRPTPSPSRWSVAGVYFFGFLLFFWPFTDLVTNAIPVQVGNLQWRYGFAGLMAAYLHTPILGLVLIAVVAYGLHHARTLRILGIFEILMAVGLVLVIVVFALDLVQVRATRPENARPAILAGGVIAILKYLTGATVLACLGIGGWRTAGRFKDPGKQQAQGTPGIVMKERAAPGGKARTG